jgi:hypothetical protein
MHPEEANRPAFADSTYTKTHYYSLEDSYILQSNSPSQ